MNTARYAINDRFFICYVVIIKPSRRLFQNIVIGGIILIVLIGLPSIRNYLGDRRTERFCLQNKGTLRETPRGELLCFYGKGKVYPTLQIKFPPRVH
jgi:hypothetical protein